MPKVDYNARRREIYRYLRAQGYSRAEAQSLRNRTRLYPKAKAVNKYQSSSSTQRRSIRRKAVKSMLESLGLSKSFANKYSSSTYKAFDIYFDGLMSEHHPIITQLYNYPELPVELSSSLYNYFKKLLRKSNSSQKITKHFASLSHGEIIKHCIRLKRFLIKVTDPYLLDKFTKNIEDGEDIADYYRSMGEVSTKIIRV